MIRQLSLLIAGFGIAITAMSGIVQAGSGTVQSDQIAAVSTNGEVIAVTTECINGAAIFKVTNIGEKLPTPYTFNIIRMNSNSVVSKRRLRLAAGQNVTFKVKNADKIPSDIGLLVNAAAYPRDGQLHASVRCTTS